MGKPGISLYDECKQPARFRMPLFFSIEPIKGEAPKSFAARHRATAHRQRPNNPTGTSSRTPIRDLVAQRAARLDEIPGQARDDIVITGLSDGGMGMPRYPSTLNTTLYVMAWKLGSTSKV
jgi:hypothetical protein